MADKNNFYNVGCASNSYYAPFMGIMIFSLLKNCSNPEKIRIFVIDGGMPKEDVQKIKRVVKDFSASIKFLKPDKELTKGLRDYRHISTDAYNRFSLIDNLNLKKILYLDGDLIVEGDVTDLFEMKFKDNILFAVKDPGGTNKRKKLLGIPLEKHYFNTGVMLVDCEKWRKENLTKKIIEYTKANPEKIAFADQDGTNVFLQDKWLELDPRWNLITLLGLKKYFWFLKITGYKKEEIKRVRKNPRVIHYAGFVKPWFFLDPVPYKKRYFYYLRQTPWKDYKQPDRTITGLAKRIFTYNKIFYKKILGER